MRFSDENAHGRSPYRSSPSGKLACMIGCVRYDDLDQNVTHRWEDWKQEMPWMSLYFSVAVWFSISFMRLPKIEERESIWV